MSGGRNIRVVNNTVFGRQQPFTNVGIYVWDWTSAGNYGGHAVRGNRVLRYKSNGQQASQWDGDNGGSIDGWSNNDWDADMSAASFNGIFVQSIPLEDASLAALANLEPPSSLSVASISYATHGGAQATEHLNVTMSVNDGNGKPVNGTTVQLKYRQRIDVAGMGVGGRDRRGWARDAEPDVGAGRRLPDDGYEPEGGGTDV